MIDFHTWVRLQQSTAENTKLPDPPKRLPEKPLETNPLGGFDPHTDEQSKVFKHVDLITLPEGVDGTNCGNCKYVSKRGKLAFCAHHEVQQWVTSRNCCALWDHEGARRSWENG